MNRTKNSRTRIIATIGPACSDPVILHKIIREGVDVCRLNFSHGTHADHAGVIETIRAINRELGAHVAILADLQGPKLRIGLVENNRVELEEGSVLTFVTEECMGTAERVYISYKPLPMDVRPGEIVLVDDGKIKLEVIDTNHRDEVRTRVIVGGPLSSKKGVNLPNTNISLPSLTEKDLTDLEFALDHDVDWVALSFVRTAADVDQLKEVIGKRGNRVRVIAKIEKPEALREIDSIIAKADAVMIARGDLGVEIPFDQVPVVQKQIVRKCILQGKAVIIATQMMESMIGNFRPTRAEATDVANAVLERADALMLSGETSVGRYPVEAVMSMQQVISATEGQELELGYDNPPDPESPDFLTDALCYKACEVAKLIGAAGIVVFTNSGDSVCEVAKYRPGSEIFAFSPNADTLIRLSLLWGVKAFLIGPEVTVAGAVGRTLETLKREGCVQSGDLLLYVAGIPLFERGRLDLMKITAVE